MYFTVLMKSLGYLAWEYPTNRLLQRLPLGKYSAACIIIWGTILSCFAAARNYPGALAIRFFLGVFEAAVTPGFALLTSQVRFNLRSWIERAQFICFVLLYVCLNIFLFFFDTILTSCQWYTRPEQGKRVNIWYSFNGCGQIIGGLVAYGIAVSSKNNGSLIAPWKIVFLFTGLLTIALGFLFLWVVPDSQLNARWLKKEDRILAIARVRVNQQGIGNKHFKWYQAKEALTDPMTWAFFFFAVFANIPNGGITNFFSQLV
jgi:ACS family allantoate permease-like MFS transporter